MSQWQHLIEKHRAALDSANHIFTWTSQEELAWLAEEASKRQFVLEIGTYRGHSAKVIASAMKVLRSSLTCFDYCPEKGIPEDALKNLDAEIKAGKVYYHQGDAGVSAARSAVMLVSFYDMIWIDDGHTYPDVVRDCLIALLLRRDTSSLICGHDYERPFNDVARAVNDCFGEKNVKRGPGSIWYL